MSPAKYEFEGVAVRVLEQDQQPWFVLSDVANVLGIAEKLRRLNGVPVEVLRMTLREMVKAARSAGWEGRCLGDLTGRAAETRLGALCRRHWEGHEMTLCGHVWLCRKRNAARESQWEWILQEEGADG
jgi:hypothetical protein